MFGRKRQPKPKPKRKRRLIDVEEQWAAVREGEAAAAGRLGGFGFLDKSLRGGPLDPVRPDGLPGLNVWS